MINKATVKYIQSLQHKKFRDEFGTFIGEGPKVVTELLADEIFECVEIYATKKGAEMIGKASTAAVNIIEDFELEKISALKVQNNVLAVFRKRTTPTRLNFSDKLTIALDDIQDPGNLGTIIRIADWFGVENIICSPATADCYNPKVVQSTMASLGRVNVMYDELEKILPQISIKKYAAVLGGKDITAIGKLKEGIIIIGNESKGISDAVLQLVDEKITIGKKGSAESLNAGVAAGIIMFALR